MKKFIPLLLLLTAVVFQLSAQYQPADFARLRALKGTWKIDKKNGSTFEIWQIKNDTLMSAISYHVNGKDTAQLESVDLAFSNGKITYTPTTPNQNQGVPVVFTLANVNGNKYSFENKTHDFPQVITYDLQSKDRLLAAISGPTANGPKTISYPFEKIPGQ